MRIKKIALIAIFLSILYYRDMINNQAIFSSVLAILLCIYLLIEYLDNSQCQLYYKKNEKLERILDMCPTIKKNKFYPSFFFQNSALQSLSALLFTPINKNLVFQLENVEDPAKKVQGITLSWCRSKVVNDKLKENILIFILPGLVGKQDDTFINNIASDLLFKAGLQPVIYNYRIISATNVMSEEDNNDHINLVEDIQLTLKYIKQKYPQYKQIYGIGHSYGANQLLNYLGDCAKDNQIQGAVSLANPFCLLIFSRCIRNTIYDFILARLLGKSLKLVKSVYEKIATKKRIDLNKAINAWHIYDFDKNFSIKVFGYPTVDTYYRKFSSVDRLKNITVPLLALNAEDDDIANILAVPKQDFQVSQNCQILMVTQKGGHIGWVEGFIRQKYWFTTPVIEFIESLIKLNSK